MGRVAGVQVSERIGQGPSGESGTQRQISQWGGLYFLLSCVILVVDCGLILRQALCLGRRVHPFSLHHGSGGSEKDKHQDGFHLVVLAISQNLFGIGVTKLVGFVLYGLDGLLEVLKGHTTRG